MLGKIDFADFVKDTKSVLGFSPFRQFRVGRNDVTKTPPGCQDSFKMATSEIASFETNFFRVEGKLNGLFLDEILQVYTKTYLQALFTGVTVIERLRNLEALILKFCQQ